MELKPEHLYAIRCEVVLFNRQRMKLLNRTVERVIYDFEGTVRVIHSRKLTGKNDVEQFFKQIKLIYLDGKIVASRGCSELPLEISNHHFSKLRNRRILLNEAEKCYRKFQKEEFYH